MGFIDLSFLIESEMPTCGTPWHQTVKIHQMGTISEVGRNTHQIVIGSHSGTHMDAPYHFYQNGETIERLDLELMCGEISIVDLSFYGKGDVVTLNAIKHQKVTKRMLFVFGWNKYWKKDAYYKDFPYFSQEAIKYLIKNGMRFIAMDTPSPDNGNIIKNMKEDSPNHKELLANGVIIVEYLTNTQYLDKNKKYRIMALPLKIAGADGSPCRVIAEEVNEYD